VGAEIAAQSTKNQQIKQSKAPLIVRYNGIKILNCQKCGFGGKNAEKFIDNFE